MTTVRNCAIIVTLTTALFASHAAADLTVAVAQTELRFWPSAEDFAHHMAERVEAAIARDPDLIVFPEDIGLPLVALGDAEALVGADSLDAAVAAMLARNAETVGKLVAEHGVSPARALWLAKAPLIREAYQEAFAALAITHGVYIAAGSVPMVSDDPARVLNTACVFDPQGVMHIIGRKVHLVPLEREDGLDFARGSMEDYTVFPMPQASLGVIICADAWDAEIAKKLVDDGADLLVQVSANPEVWTDNTRATWQESLLTRVEELGVHGVCAMAVGDLLGVPFHGRSAVLAPRDLTDDRSGYLAEAGSATEEEIIVETLDLGRDEDAPTRLFEEPILPSKYHHPEYERMGYDPAYCAGGLPSFDAQGRPCMIVSYPFARSEPPQTTVPGHFGDLMYLREDGWRFTDLEAIVREGLGDSQATLAGYSKKPEFIAETGEMLLLAQVLRGDGRYDLVLITSPDHFESFEVHTIEAGYTPRYDRIATEHFAGHNVIRWPLVIALSRRSPDEPEERFVDYPGTLWYRVLDRVDGEVTTINSGVLSESASRNPIGSMYVTTQIVSTPERTHVAWHVTDVGVERGGNETWIRTYDVASG
ncbi:MAG: hypothetical protein GF393_06455, partial [Armatimonadia bacterium]|nr:hypothetical protein [Armatimonadia bacterium]